MTQEELKVFRQFAGFLKSREVTFDTDECETLRYLIIKAAKRIEVLEEALEQVIVDVNDPHPRNSTLEGFRESLKSTEKYLEEVLKKANEPMYLR